MGKPVLIDKRGRSHESWDDGKDHVKKPSSPCLYDSSRPEQMVVEAWTDPEIAELFTDEEGGRIRYLSIVRETIQEQYENALGSALATADRIIADHK